MRYQPVWLSASVLVGCATSVLPVGPPASSPGPSVAEARRSGAPPTVSTSVSSAPAVTTLLVEVTDDGFVPNSMTVMHNQRVTFIFHRTTRKKCLHEVIVHLADTVHLRLVLPLDEPFEFTLTFTEPGARRLSCGTGMYGATIHVL